MLKQLGKCVHSLLSKQISASKTQITSYRNMKIQIDQVKGMKELNRDLFQAQVKVPVIKVNRNQYSAINKLLKQFGISIADAKRYRELSEDDELSKTHLNFLMDPDEFKSIEESFSEDIRKKLSEEFQIDFKKHLTTMDIVLRYESFKFDEIMKLVIPDELINENVNVKSFSIIGHIAHFNLKDKILDYKKLIGQVLLDKQSNIKTVMNKTNEIDNTYRNFSYEILAGEKNTLANCKENLCTFKFDFAHVYWNPRLSMEHERIINLLSENDILYDVFAGVGPFSVPAATKKGCVVLANDLNPNSYKYLKENYEINLNSKQRKIKFKFLDQDCERLQAFNLDGREFIRTKLKEHLYAYIKTFNEKKPEKVPKIHVVMNLPAMAVEFIDAFANLFNEEESQFVSSLSNLSDFTLNVNCYCFAKCDPCDIDEIIKVRCKDVFSDADMKVDYRFVRKVAPNKDMYCLKFQLSIEKTLLNQDCNESASKRLKV